jgi:O-succinylbenzoic acid--CoA ligase
VAEPKLLSQWAQTRADETALIVDGQALSWQQLTDRLSVLAGSLQAQGVSRNSVVALVSKNSYQLLLMYLAAVRIGALPALLAPQPLSQLEEKREVLASDFVWWGRESRTGFSEQEMRRSVDLRTITFELDPRSDSPDGETAQHARGLVSVVFTSGSTGTPKAVAHSAGQHIASASGLLERFAFTRDDAWLLSLPMYHVSGLSIVWRWLVAGARLIIGEGGDLARDLRYATHASLVTTQLQRLLDSGAPLHLKRVLLGGSYIPPELAMAARARGIETWLGYGMTEAASTVTAKPVDGQSGVGFLLPNRKLKVHDKRILVGGMTLAQGYYRRGELIPLTRDGWYDSKDLGELIHGELHILGRSDNQFVSGGENIHCEEIEAVLNRHPNVQAAVVIPVEDREFGARPVAVVLPRGEFRAEIMPDFLGDKLHKYKWPQAYFTLPAEVVPQSQIKLSRSAIKTWFSRNQSSYVMC